MRFLEKFFIFYKPDGEKGGAGEPPKDEKGEDKGGSVADEMKALQKAHEEEMKKLKKQLADEQAQHAKDLREKLLHGSGDGQGDEKNAAQKIYETMKKKYSN